MDGGGSARLRGLPSVGAELNAPAAAVPLEQFGRLAATQAVRAALQEARASLQAGAPVAVVNV